MKLQRLGIHLIVLCLLVAVIGLTLASCGGQTPAQPNDTVPTETDAQGNPLPPETTTDGKPLPPAETTTDGKSVPIYQGMSITTGGAALRVPVDAGDLSSLASWSFKTKAHLVPLDHKDKGDDRDDETEKQNPNNNGNGNNNGNIGNGTGNNPHKNFEAETNAPYEGDIEDVVTIEIPGDEVTKYFVAPGEVFTVEVYLSNPDQFEIQSFTLNGNKYANYMFKENSTLELLRLDVTAPTEPGYFELTIDAIKYIDGTEIKDVRMDGDKTVKAGVTYPEAPVAEYFDISVGATSVTMTVSVTDPLGVLTGVPAVFYLSDGEQIISELMLDIGANTVTVDGLHMGTAYEYGVMAAYDPVDGTGVQPRWLSKQTVETQDGFLVTDVTIGQAGLDFVLEQPGETATIESIVFYDALSGEVALTMEDTTVSAVSGLLSAHDYRMVLSYAYPFGEETIRDEIAIQFTTLAKTAPTLAIEQVTAEQTAISFELAVTDVDGILVVDKIDLYSGDQVAATAADGTVRAFAELFTNHDYVLRVAYSYDLGDGAGVHSEVVEVAVKTLAKATPAVTLTSVTSEQTTLSFTAEVTDTDGLISIDAIELWDGDAVVIKTEDLLALNFAGLLTNHSYTLKVAYSYDLGDGAGVHNEVTTLAAKTKAKTAPVVTVISTAKTQTQLGFAATLTDPDGLFELKAIELLDGETVVATAEEFDTQTFSALLTNHSYTLKITYSYDLGDGAGAHIVTAACAAKTDARTIPTVLVGNPASTQTSMSFDITTTDPDGVLSVSAVELLMGADVVATVPYAAHLEFSGLEAGTQYTARVTYTYDLGDGAGVQKKIAERAYPTLAASIFVDEVILLNENVVKKGEEINLSIFFKNSSSIELLNIYVNGQKVEVVGGNRIDRAIVKFVPDDTGLVVFSVDRVEYLYYGEIVTQRIDSDVTVTYPVYSDLSVKFEPVSLSPYEHTGTGIYLEFDNTDGYTVYTINNSTDFVALSDHLFFVYSDNISSIEYGYDNYGSTLQAFSFWQGAEIWCSTIQEIYTVEEFLAMTDGYYILMNDLDLSRLKADYTINLYGVLDGNGHTVTGLSGIVDTGTKEYTPIITGGSIYDVVFKDVYFNVTHSQNYWIQVSPFGDARFINSRVTGDITVTGSDLAVRNLSEHSNRNSLSYNMNVALNGQQQKQNYTATTTVKKKPAATLQSGYVYYVFPNGDAMFLQGISAGHLLVPSFAGLSIDENGLAYALSKDMTASVIGFDGTVTDLVIPETIEGYTVVSVGNSLFSGRDTLTSVEIQANITAISDNMFNGCSNLTSVKLPATVTAIGDYAFYNCQELTAIELPASVTVLGAMAFHQCVALETVTFAEGSVLAAIGREAFSNCQSLTAIELPLSLTTIGESAFGNCQSLKSINLPEGLVEIGIGAFRACYSLSAITLPSTLTTIGTEAFLECSNIAEIYIPASVTTVGEGAFRACWALPTIYVAAPEKPAGWHKNWNNSNWDVNGKFTVVWNVAGFHTDAQGLKYLLVNDGTASVIGFDGSVTEVVIPETIEGYTVVSVGNSLFSGRDALTSVEIQADITAISDNMFTGCSNLAALDIPASVTAIGNGAFASCHSLTSIEIPASVTTIADNAFSSCSRLASVTFADGSRLTSIGHGAFNGCNALTEILLPATLESIGDQVFQSTALSEIYIPASVTTVGQELFLYGSAPIIYAAAPEKPAGWNRYWNARNWEHTETISVIWNVAGFHTDAQGLTYLLVNDGTASVIGFDGTVTDLVIPETIEGYTVTGLKAYFLNGITPTSLVIPASVTTVEENAVVTNGYINIYIRHAEKPAGWSDNWLNVQMSAMGERGLVYWNYQDVCKDENGLSYVLRNDGTAAVVGFDGTVTELVIPATIRDYRVTSIRRSLFAYNEQLISVDIQAEISEIEYEMFRGCSALTTVKLPATLTTIGEGAFRDLVNLESVTFAEGSVLATIGDCAFYNCQELTAIELPASVTVLGAMAFHQCVALETVTFAEGSVLAAIGREAFSNCQSLTAIELPLSLTTIGESAFGNCQSLKSINLPEGLVEIGIGAFRACYSLSAITLPSTLTTIGTEAFLECSNITEIYIPASVTTVGEGAFRACWALPTIYVAAPEKPAGWHKNWNNSNWDVNGKFTVIWNVAGFHTDAQGLEYCLWVDGAASVIGFDGTVTDLVIPETVEGYTVTGLKAYFLNGITPTSLVIPASVTTVEENAVVTNGYINIYIRHAEKPAGWSDNWLWVESWGAYGEFCEVYWSFEDFYEDENGLSYVLRSDGTAAVRWFTNTATERVIPATVNGRRVTSVRRNLFRYQEQLISVDIQAEITEIFMDTFMGCTSLTTVKLPATLTTIGESAFRDLVNLESVTFAEGSVLATIGDYAFYNCQELTAIEIPASVATIGTFAFAQCQRLTTVTFAERGALTVLDEYVFRACTSLTSVRLPEGLEEIRPHAFEDCFELAAVKLPSTLKSIGEYAFHQVVCLTGIYIPASVECIDDRAFSACHGLSVIYVAAAEQPAGWDEGWNDRGDGSNPIPVVWNTPAP